MRQRTTVYGFSLVEVILAVGIFAVAVPTALALLSALEREGGMGAEMLVAHRLGDSVRVELERLAKVDFEGFAATVPVMNSMSAAGLALVATRNGPRLHARDNPPSGPGIATADQYFLIECWRFPEEPLRFDPTKAHLAIAVRVTWPFRFANGTTAAQEAQSTFTFTVVLNR